MQSSSKNIVFIHGGWVTPLCFDRFIPFFEERGYTCVAPAWPGKDIDPDEQRRTTDPRLLSVGFEEITKHYEKLIGEMKEPPILIGHSFGGLIAQILIGRGFGKAGIALNSAPPKGVSPFHLSTIKILLPMYLTPFFWKKSAPMPFDNFQHAVGMTIPLDEQKRVYAKYVVPESGRLLLQAAFMPFHNLTSVNFKNDKRSPLLLVAGSIDEFCTPEQNYENFKKYKNSSAVTDFKTIEDVTHWSIGGPHRKELAELCMDWLEKQENNR